MTKARGKILLSGFSLTPEERTIIDNLIKSYERKLEEKIGYEKIRMRMKKSEHGKAFLHQIQGTLISGKNQFKTEVAGYNLFSAMAEALEKLMNEAEHKKRTSRQVK